MVQSIAITDFRDLSKLYTKRKQVRRLAKSELRVIRAIDTETFNGDIFLIADDQGNYLDKTITADSVLDFLFSKRYQGSWNFMYNLSYDVECVLKLLGKYLMVYVKTRKTRFKYKDYNIMYIPGKCIRISKGHHSVVFYDIAQYYNRAPLAKAYQDNVGKLDKVYLDFKSKRDQFSPRFYRDHTSQVRDYCIRDCQLTKELAEKWTSLFYKAFGFYPARWISAGYLAEKVLINNNVFFPSFDSIPYQVQDLAYKCSFGGRFEIIKRGFIGTAYLYDVNSAYPAAIANLPDLTDGKWITRKLIHPQAALGFFEIEADIPDLKMIPPFPFKKNGMVIFPSGRFRTFVTLDELKACENSDYYKVINSWQFIPNSERKPYQNFINSMYEKRLRLKRNKDSLQLPFKVILNSFYGKTGQKVNRVIGNLFNPVLFSSITGFTRAKMYRFVIEKGLEKEIVAFATDSICTTRDLGLKSEKLGEFTLDKSGNDVYYLQNGIYRFNGVWKERGLGKLGNKIIDNIEIVEKDGRLYLKLVVVRSTRLRSSILQGRIQDIGKISPRNRMIDLDADRKRFWLGKLQSVNSDISNKSLPISLDHFFM